MLEKNDDTTRGLSTRSDRGGRFAIGAE